MYNINLPDVKYALVNRQENMSLIQIDNTF